MQKKNVQGYAQVECRCSLKMPMMTDRFLVLGLHMLRLLCILDTLIRILLFQTSAHAAGGGADSYALLSLLPRVR